MLKRIPFVRHFGAALLLGALTGGITGAVITLYKYVAHHVIHYSEQAYHLFHRQPLWLILAVAVVGGVALLWAAIYRKTTNLRGGGIPTAIGVLRGIFPFRWLRNAIGVLTLSLSTFLVGVPLGNEGPSVQLGTALGQGATTLCGKKGKAWNRYGMTGGACAGFSTATGAPLSGILFAVEEAHHKVSPLLLTIAAAAVGAARLVSELLSPLLGVSATLFPPMELKALTLKECWLPLALGVAMGLFAVLFLTYYKGIAHLMNRKLARVPLPYKLFTILLLTLAAGTVSFSAVSTGHELVLSLFSGETALSVLLVLLLVRTTLTVGANASGITGGVFLPILAIGTLMAGIFASVAGHLGLDPAYTPVILVLGLTATIAALMKMPLTAVAFAIEALSGATLILPILLVVIVSYGITELLGAVSITDHVLEERIEKTHTGTATTAETVVTVQPGTFAEGKEIRDILWPDGVTILAVNGHHVCGETALHAGDDVLIRYTTYHESRLQAELADLIGEQATVPQHQSV